MQRGRVMRIAPQYLLANGNRFDPASGPVMIESGFQCVQSHDGCPFCLPSGGEGRRACDLDGLERLDVQRDGNAVIL